MVADNQTANDGRCPVCLGTGYLTLSMAGFDVPCYMCRTASPEPGGAGDDPCPNCGSRAELEFSPDEPSGHVCPDCGILVASLPVPSDQ